MSFLFGALIGWLARAAAHSIGARRRPGLELPKERRGR